MTHTFVSKHIRTAPQYISTATRPRLLSRLVRESLIRWLSDEIGNAGSRTHEYGVRANRAVQAAREQVAAVVGQNANEIIFTSGATESNNLAVLGIAAHGEAVGRRHIISTAIEHKAVLEPLEALAARGFDVMLVKPEATGAVSGGRHTGCAPSRHPARVGHACEQ